MMLTSKFLLIWSSFLPEAISVFPEVAVLNKAKKLTADYLLVEVMP